MARIGILTCSNCTQDGNCASVVCLRDMRKRQAFFERYADDETLDLIGVINCAGCPTLAAPEKILKRVKALADYNLDALHFSYCMTALCPFLNKFQKVIGSAYPDLELVYGTHVPKDVSQFRTEVHEVLCPSSQVPQDMNNIIKGTLKKKKAARRKKSG